MMRKSSILEYIDPGRNIRCLLGYFRAEQSSMALCYLEAFGRAGLAGLDAVFKLGGILRVVE